MIHNSIIWSTLTIHVGLVDVLDVLPDVSGVVGILIHGSADIDLIWISLHWLDFTTVILHLLGVLHLVLAVSPFVDGRYALCALIGVPGHVVVHLWVILIILNVLSIVVGSVRLVVKMLVVVSILHHRILDLVLIEVILLSIVSVVVLIVPLWLVLV